MQRQQRSLQATAGPSFDSHQPEFVLSPGTFEVDIQIGHTYLTNRKTSCKRFTLLLCLQVLLCVDNTETTGGGTGGRATLKEETVRHLQQFGVPYDRRGLNIGDFLWVAREKVEQVVILMYCPCET